MAGRTPGFFDIDLTDRVKSRADRGRWGDAGKKFDTQEDCI
jgi:hypothetical protein